MEANGGQTAILDRRRGNGKERGKYYEAGNGEKSNRAICQISPVGWWMERGGVFCCSRSGLSPVPRGRRLGCLLDQYVNWVRHHTARKGASMFSAHVGLCAYSRKTSHWEVFLGSSNR